MPGYYLSESLVSFSRFVRVHSFIGLCFYFSFSFRPPVQLGLLSSLLLILRLWPTLPYVFLLLAYCPRPYPNARLLSPALIPAFFFTAWLTLGPLHAHNSVYPSHHTQPTPSSGRNCPPLPLNVRSTHTKLTHLSLTPPRNAHSYQLPLIRESPRSPEKPSSHRPCQAS